MNDVLALAQQKMNFKSVSLRKSDVSFNEDYDSDFELTADHNIQTFSSVHSVKCVEFIEQSNPENKKWEYRILHRSGIRVVEDLNTEDDEASEVVVFEIRANFELTYVAFNEVVKEEMDAFVEKNVTFNVWPFWREYIQSTCLRMNVQPLPLPFVTMYDENDS